MGIMIFFSILVVSGCGQYIFDKANRNDLVIIFPQVGQADAAILRHNGRTVLIDCGPRGLPGRDSPVASVLQRMGIRKIDALFLSHLHPDHVGGLKDIMNTWPVKVLYLFDFPEGRREWKNFMDGGQVDAKIRFLRYGEKVDLLPLKFTVYGPEVLKGPPENINRGSLQLLMEFAGFKALFTGDAGWDQVLRSLDAIQDLDLIKIPHHGSKKNFPPVGMDDVITRMRPYDDFIAVCPSRSPGERPLPAREVVNWFERRGIRVVYTGDSGVKVKRAPVGGPDQ